MPGNPNSSFIPKRNPIKKNRKTLSRRVYTFTLISYVLLFSVLLASLGVYLYKEYVTRQHEAAVADLSNEVARFKLDDLDRVRQFDERLRLAAERVDRAASVPALFTAFESVVVSTAAIKQFDLTRAGDATLAVAATLQVDDFDSTLFQRSLYESNNIISNVVVSNLTKQALVTESQGGATNPIFLTEDQTYVSFTTNVTVDLAAIPYDPTWVTPIGDQTSPVLVEPIADPVASTTEVFEEDMFDFDSDTSDLLDEANIE